MYAVERSEMVIAARENFQRVRLCRFSERKRLSWPFLSLQGRLLGDGLPLELDLHVPLL